MKHRFMFTLALAWLVVVLGLAPAPAQAVPARYWEECVHSNELNSCALGRDRPEAIQNVVKSLCGNFLANGFSSCAFLDWHLDPNRGAGLGYLVISFCRDAYYCSTYGGNTNGSSSVWDTCTIATQLTGKCGKTAKDLQATTPGATDPTRVFHKTQTCIAAKSCALRCTLDDCDWLNELVPNFVGRYLAEVDSWPTIKARCRAPRSPFVDAPTQDLVCATQEGAHHIINDLVPALSTYGCGSDADWDKVYGVLKTCAAEAMAPYFPGAIEISQLSVYALRQGARGLCITNRTLAGLPININPPLKGQVCTP